MQLTARAKLERQFFKCSTSKEARKTSTHLAWINPSPAPTYACFDLETDFADLIAAAYFQARVGVSFCGNLPCVHEIATEVFPIFIDIDDIPTDTDSSLARDAAAVCCNAIGRSVVIHEGYKIYVFTNNPEWMIEREPPCTRTPFTKYGLHIIFDKRLVANAATMYPLALWLAGLWEKNGQLPGKIDTGLYKTEGCVKLRMPYCDRAHPYQNKYYGLMTIFEWRNNKVNRTRLSEDLLEPTPEVVANIIRDGGSIRLKDFATHKTEYNKWETFVWKVQDPTSRFTIASAWFKNERTLRRLYYEVLAKVDKKSIQALMMAEFPPVLMYYNNTLRTTSEEVKHVLIPIILNHDRPDREDVLAEAVRLVNCAVFWIQVEQAYFQITEDHRGNVTLNKMGAATPAAFNLIGLQVPVVPPPPPTPEQRGRPKWECVPFVKFWECKRKTYESIYFDPRAMKPDYVPAAAHFNVFPGYALEPSHFIDFYKEHQHDPLLKAKFVTFREWLRIGLCGGKDTGQDCEMFSLKS